MVFYKPQDEAGSAFDFVFSVPFSAGLIGRQYVQYNTFQPSLKSLDLANKITNWVQLTNYSTSTQRGNLKFYDANGTLVRTEVVTLTAGKRKDFSAHRFGVRKVGLIEWIPDSDTARFTLRLIRYFFDNQDFDASFSAATAFEGQAANGEVLSLSLIHI